MGKLLSSAIKMQNGSVASPTLTVNFTELYAGGAVDVYKNGVYYGSPTSGVPLNVPIVAGNTFYLVLIPAFDGTESYSYYVNANQNYTNPEACGEAATCTGGQPVPEGHNPAAPFRKSGVEGGSLEAIYRITNPVTSPVGVGLYLEPTLGRNKNEIEARLLLQSNFIDDRLIVAGNVVVANEQLKFVGNGNVPESMLDFLVGASYRFAPHDS